MNKSQGVTATAFVLVGALLRAITMQYQSPANSWGTIAAVSTVASLSEAKGLGPWVASCEYWAPARLAIPKGECEGQISINLRRNDAQFDATITSYRGVTKQYAYAIPLLLGMFVDPVSGKFSRTWQCQRGRL
jgi:hypothetical protein